MNSECIDLEGSFKCNCLPGFELTEDEETVLGSTCIDIDECSTIGFDICETSQGLKPAKFTSCQNTQGSYECSCKPGFYKSEFPEIDDISNQAFYKCLDIDECAEGNIGCSDERMTCLNTDGSYQCSCPGGYEIPHSSSGIETDSSNCQDIDECAWPDLNTCDVGDQFCINLPGSYKCCNVWQEYDEELGDCKDIDYCETLNIVCGENEICKSGLTKETTVCDCINDTGFIKTKVEDDDEKKECVDIDECTVFGGPEGGVLVVFIYEFQIWKMSNFSQMRKYFLLLDNDLIQHPAHVLILKTRFVKIMLAVTFAFVRRVTR